MSRNFQEPIISIGKHKKTSGSRSAKERLPLVVQPYGCCYQSLPITSFCSYLHATSTVDSPISAERAISQDWEGGEVSQH
jgi:hypothetical protein